MAPRCSVRLATTFSWFSPKAEPPRTSPGWFAPRSAKRSASSPCAHCSQNSKTAAFRDSTVSRRMGRTGVESLTSRNSTSSCACTARPTTSDRCQRRRSLHQAQRARSRVRAPRPPPPRDEHRCPVPRRKTQSMACVRPSRLTRARVAANRCARCPCQTRTPSLVPPAYRSKPQASPMKSPTTPPKPTRHLQVPQARRPPGSPVSAATEPKRRVVLPAFPALGQRPFATVARPSHRSRPFPSNPRTMTTIQPRLALGHRPGATPSPLRRRALEVSPHETTASSHRTRRTRAHPVRPRTQRLNGASAKKPRQPLPKQPNAPFRARLRATLQQGFNRLYQPPNTSKKNLAPRNASPLGSGQSQCWCCSPSVPGFGRTPQPAKPPTINSPTKAARWPPSKVTKRQFATSATYTTKPSDRSSPIKNYLVFTRFGPRPCVSRPSTFARALQTRRRQTQLTSPKRSQKKRPLTHPKPSDWPRSQPRSSKAQTRKRWSRWLTHTGFKKPSKMQNAR